MPHLLQVLSSILSFSKQLHRFLAVLIGSSISSNEILILLYQIICSSSIIILILFQLFFQIVFVRRSIIAQLPNLINVLIYRSELLIELCIIWVISQFYFYFLFFILNLIFAFFLFLAALALVIDFRLLIYTMLGFDDNSIVIFLIVLCFIITVYFVTTSLKMHDWPFLLQFLGSAVQFEAVFEKMLSLLISSFFLIICFVLTVVWSQNITLGHQILVISILCGPQEISFSTVMLGLVTITRIADFVKVINIKNFILKRFINTFGYNSIAVFAVLLISKDC